MKTWKKVALILLIPVLAITAVWCGMALAAPELPAALAPAVARAEKQKRKLVLLLTGSTWCIDCQRLEKNAFATPAWQAFIKDEILLETYDYPADRSAPTPVHEALRQLPGFRGYPTLVIASPAGKLLALRDGSSISAAELIAWIRSL